MTFLIKIQLLNWQQNVYQSTSCPENWASVFTSYTNKLQSQVAITFEKHKLATKKYYKLSTLITHRWLEADASRPRPELLEAKATILGPRAVLELEDSPRGPHPCQQPSHVRYNGTRIHVDWGSLLGKSTLATPTTWMLCDRSVCLSVCLSLCEQDYWKSDEPISLKLGVMIWPTNQKNWLTFGRALIPDMDSGLIFHFPHHLRITGFVMQSLLPNFYETWWHDWCC